MKQLGKKYTKLGNHKGRATAAHAAETGKHVMGNRTASLRYAGVTILFATLIVGQTLASGSALRLALSLAVQGLVLLLLGWLTARFAGRLLHELGFRKREVFRILLLILACGCAGAVFILVFFKQEQDIKTYDSAVYWVRMIEDRLILAESIPDYLVSLRNSFAREYNHLAVFPLIPLSFILGIDFAGYCLAVFLAYHLPACLFLTILALRLHAAMRGGKPGVASFAACFAFCLLSPALMWPVMNGYLDVAGVLVMAIMLNYSLHWDGAEFSVERNLRLAALSLLLLFARRWYGFYIVGFYFSVGTMAVAAMIAGKRFSVAALGRSLANLIMIAGVSCLVMAAINPALFTLFLGGDYALAYSAYKNSDLWTNLWTVARNTGLLWVAAAGVGTYSLARRPATRWQCLRLVLAAFVAAALFCAVQDMGYHHHYLLLPTVIVLAGVFCLDVTGFALRKRAPVLVVLLLAACLFNFAAAFTPGLRRIAGGVEPFITSLRSYPKQNPDYSAVRQLVVDLADRIGTASRYVYVIGDGSSLSPEVLKRSRLPEVVDAAPFVLINNIVDLRDGFPSQLFLADYVLTSDTLRTEFATPQMVSVQAHDMLLHDPAAAAHYELDSTYATTEGNLLLYRKRRPVDAAFVDRLQERLKERYPARPFVYQPNYFIALFQADGGVKYSYNKWDDNAFTLTKPAGAPVIFRLHGTDTFATLSFALSAWTGGLELIVENQDGVIFRSPVKQAEKQAFTVNISGSERLTVGVIDANQGASVDATIILYHPVLR